MRTDSDLAPIGNAAWPKEIDDMLDGFAGGLNVYRTMAHHPALLRAWTDLRAHIVTKTSLGAVRAEVVILRTGTRLASAYEWQQHIQRARKVGMDDARIASIRGVLSEMSEEDALLSRAVDELFEFCRLKDDTRKALAKLVGTAAMIDLMATVGFYSTLGFILNSFAVPLDKDIAAELAASPLTP